MPDGAFFISRADYRQCGLLRHFSVSGTRQNTRLTALAREENVEKLKQNSHHKEHSPWILHVAENLAKGFYSQVVVRTLVQLASVSFELL